MTLDITKPIVKRSTLEEVLYLANDRDGNYVFQFKDGSIVALTPYYSERTMMNPNSVPRKITKVHVTICKNKNDEYVPILALSKLELLNKCIGFKSINSQVIEMNLEHDE